MHWFHQILNDYASFVNCGPIPRTLCTPKRMQLLLQAHRVESYILEASAPQHADTSSCQEPLSMHSSELCHTIGLQGSSLGPVQKLIILNGNSWRTKRLISLIRECVKVRNQFGRWMLAKDDIWSTFRRVVSEFGHQQYLRSYARKTHVYDLQLLPTGQRLLHLP